MKAWNKTMDLQQIFALEVAHLAIFGNFLARRKRKGWGSLGS